MRYRIGAIALASTFTLTTTLAACGDELDETPSAEADVVQGADDLSWIDDLSLSLLTVSVCQFNTTTGVLDIDTTSTLALISKRAIDKAILINGRSLVDHTGCSSTPTTSVNPLSDTIKKLEFDASTGAETLILDFLNGAFAASAGTAAAPTGGFDIKMSTGADAVKIRGTTGVDVYTAGGTLTGTILINTANDAVRDMVLTGNEVLALAGAAGADTITGAGGAGTGTVPFVGVLTISGGDGNDVLTGGDSADIMSGGAGNDTLAGGLGADTLNGDEGDDTFNEASTCTAAGDTATGADTFNGGTGSADKVDYSGRTATACKRIHASIGAGTLDDGSTTAAHVLGALTVVTQETDDIKADVEQVVGTSFDDSFVGPATTGSAACTLSGGPGKDVFEEGSAKNGACVFNGGTGTDTMNYAGTNGRDAGTNKPRQAVVTVTMDGTAANDGDQTAPVEGDNVKSDVENIRLGEHGGTFTGNALANTFLNASEGKKITAATFNGGAGVDTVDYSTYSGASLHITMSGTAISGVGSAATGTITLLAVGDGDTVTINDGTTIKTFEADTNSSVTSGNVAFSVSDPDIADAAKLVAAINGTTLKVTARSVSTATGRHVAVVTVQADDVGTGPNTSHTLAETGTTITISGATFSGGVASEGDTISATDVEAVLGGNGDATIGNVLIGNALDNELTGGQNVDQFQGLGGSDTLDSGLNTLGSEFDLVDCGTGAGMNINAGAIAGAGLSVGTDLDGDLSGAATGVADTNSLGTGGSQF
jgi:hypothetical protein